MFTFLKFNIPSPIEWSTSQVANIIALISAFATVGALWYAIRQGIKNSRKINELSAIAKQLSDQNHLILEQNNLQKLAMKNEVRPNLVVGGASTMGTEGTLKFNITNTGHKAIIKNIEYKEDYVNFTKKSLPFQIKKDAIIEINGVSNGREHITNSAWAIVVHYRDAYNNDYQFYIQGTGNNIKQGDSE